MTPEPPSRTNVRRATEGDLLGVLRVMARTEESVAPHVEEASPLQRSTWESILATENLSIFVAESNHIIGTATFLKMPNLGYQCRPSGFIEAMVVAVQHRRQGIAQSILEAILSDARKAGCHKIQLLTHKRHATDGAHEFYRSMGFEAEAEGFRLYLDT